MSEITNIDIQNSLQLARKYSTETMVAKAYSEYTSSVMQSYSKFLNVVTSIVNEENDVFSILRDNDLLAKSQVVLNTGLFDFRTLCDDIAYSISQFDNQENLSDDDQTPLLSQNAINYGHLYVEDLLQEINLTYHSIVSEAGIAEALAQGDTFQSKLSIARDFISQQFSSGYTDFSGYLEFGIDLMKKSSSVFDYIEKVMMNSGLQPISDDSDPMSNFNQSNDFKFTGATPGSAYCWDTLGNVAVSTVAVVAKGVVGAVKGLWNLGKKLFSKAKEKVVEIVVDPYDITLSDEQNGNNTVDGYAHMKHFSKDIPYNEVPSYLLKNHVNEWYHTDWFCSEVMTRINSIGLKEQQAAINVLAASSRDDSFRYFATAYYQYYWDSTRQPFLDIYLEGSLPQLLNYFGMNQGIPPYSFNASDVVSDAQLRELFLNLISWKFTLIPEVSYTEFINPLLQVVSLDKISDNVNEAYLSLYNSVMSGIGRPDLSVQNISSCTWQELAVLALAMCGVAVDADEVVRYKPVHYSLLNIDDLENFHETGYYQFESSGIIHLFDSIINSASVYASVDSPEWYLFNSFQFGKLCHNILMSIMHAEIVDFISNPNSIPSWVSDPENNSRYITVNYAISDGVQITGYDFDYSGDVFDIKTYIAAPTYANYPSWFTHYGLTPRNGYKMQFFTDVPVFISATTQVSNQMFFNTIIGQHPLAIDYFQDVVELLANDMSYGYGQSNIDIFGYNGSVIGNILLLLHIQYVYPFQYPFWPYSKTYIEWFPCSFKIRTDQQNISAFNTFVTTAVVVTAALLTIGITSAIIKRKATLATLKEKGLSATLSNKAVDGTITNGELRQYRKAVRKNNRLNKLSGNLNIPKLSTDVAPLVVPKDYSSKLSSLQDDSLSLVKIITGQDPE